MTDAWKNGLAAIALVSLPLVAACSDTEEHTAQGATRDDGTLTLAAALGAEKDLDIVREAMEESELSGVLDGPASYTILAPDDAAFEALGKEGETLLEDEQRPVLVALLEDEQRPVLVALLRDHLLPGHLTPESIGEAIDRKGGPVTMATLGETDVIFSREGDGIKAELEDGGSASFAGTATATNNGVVIPISQVLMPPKD